MWLANARSRDLSAVVKLLSLPKPLLFLLVGALGALLGWGVGEIFATNTPPPAATPLVEEVSPGVFRRNSTPATAAPSLLFDSAVQGRLAAAGASMSGDIMAALSWETYDDLDLHCFDPSGVRIYFRNRRSPSDGELDVDQNVDAPLRDNPVEHIYWPTGSAPSGKYVFKVFFYNRRSELTNVPFRLDVQIGDKLVSKSGSLASAGPGEAFGKGVFEFDYQKSTPATRKFNLANFLLGVASVGFTLGFLALGTSCAISVAQARMLGADTWVPRNFARIVMLGLCSGVLAGLAGQSLLTFLSSGLGIFGAKWLKVVAWVVVGGMLGFAFSLIIPNLNRAKAILGGLGGGTLAGLALSFLLADVPTFGRFAACIILGGAVGLSVALVEALAREGYLRVIWGPGEFTTVNLGATPVTVGTGVESTVKIPKSSGFPATIATFTMRDGKATMYHNMTGATHALRDGNKLPLGTVTIEVKLFS